MSNLEILLNDERLTLPLSQPMLSEVLKSQNLEDKKGIAVAVNNSIIRKDLWPTTPVKQHDKIMVITATQGG